MVAGRKWRRCGLGWSDADVGGTLGIGVFTDFIVNCGKIEVQNVVY